MRHYTMITPTIKNHILSKDIPYSLGIMNAHSNNTIKPWTGDPNILNAMFVGSLIKGRLFLEFIGIKINKRLELVNNTNTYYTDNIKIEDIGGKCVDLTSLSLEEKELLRQFLISTNKHEAHLALPPENNNLDHIKPAFTLINRLLINCLPQK